jgi:glycosyltransferase involved in cell wall biosynthesis
VVQLSVILPFHNAAATLARCLAALSAQTYPRDLVEIIAVDNNSTDRSADIVAQFPAIRLLQEPIQGAYAARNRGIRDARGRVLVFTDPDCVPTPDWLSAIAQDIDIPGTAVVIGGYVVPRHSEAMQLLVRYENTKDAFVFSSAAPELYYGHTNNMAVLHDVFEQFGPFVQRRRGADTIFVRRVVDALSYRAVRYSSAALVDHLELDGIATYYRKMMLYGESRESYRHISWTRPLTLRERFVVFRRTCADHALSVRQTTHLLALLSMGLVSWRAGRARAQLARLVRGSGERAAAADRYRAVF